MKVSSKSRWSELGRWTEEAAREVLEAWAASGESAPRFASQHGLSVQRLYWWRQRLDSKEDDPETGAPQSFVPLPIRVDDLPMRTTAWVHLVGGIVLEVPVSASPGWVAAVAQALSRP